MTRRKASATSTKLKIKLPHPLEWLMEPLMEKPDLVRRKMFGCEAAYLGDRMVLVLAAGKEPWNGALFPAERENHGALLQKYPELKPHPILGKWLYLSQKHPEFEEISTRIVEQIVKRDPRWGAVPKPKKKTSPRRDSPRE